MKLEYTLWDGIGKVELLGSFGTDDFIANCTRPGKPEREGDKNEKLIAYLAEHEHHSPFEFCNATFRLTTTLDVITHFLRHRTMKFNQISYRYEKAIRQFYTPNQFRKQAAGNHQASGEPLHPDLDSLTRKFHDDACNASFDYYEKMLMLGTSREQARGVLPQHTYSILNIQGDIRNLSHLFNLRVDRHAQLETQWYATAMYKLIKPRFPAALNSLKRYEVNEEWFKEWCYADEEGI
jgi:thymidylate synthase (FAD)